MHLSVAPRAQLLPRVSRPADDVRILGLLLALWNISAAFTTATALALGRPVRGLCVLCPHSAEAEVVSMERGPEGREVVTASVPQFLLHPSFHLIPLFIQSLT